jgi:hypothetical protein
MTDGPFSRATMRWLVAIGVLSLVSFVVLIVWLDPGELVDSAGNDTFSRSAVGHHAFLELVRRLDIPVTVSRFESGRRAGDTALLVLLEPSEEADEIGRTLDGAKHALIALPKWWGLRDRDRPSHVRRVELVIDSSVEEVLEGAGAPGSVVRSKAAPLEFDGEFPGRGPLLPIAQLVRSEHLVPLVSSSRGTLLGRIRGTSHYVLSDPDVLANHGLHHPGNAVFTAWMLDLVRRGDRPVVVDETLHGHERRPRLWRSLFDFPLVLAFAHGLVVLVLLLWAATGRFGPPEGPEPAHAAGKRVLTDNTAALLAEGPHAPLVLQRYLDTRIRRAGAAFGAPGGLGPSELADWLTRHEAGRVTVSIEILRQRVADLSGRESRQEARALEIARAIRRWKEEILDGSRSRT